MKNNMILMLTFLLLLVSYFSSATTTGAFWRETSTGPTHIGGTTPGQNTFDDSRYFVRTSALSPDRVFLGSSTPRTSDYIETHPEIIERLDVNNDGTVDQEDCTFIHTSIGRLQSANSAGRISAQRFRQPALLQELNPDGTLRADVTLNGDVDDTDYRICTTALKGKQDLFNENKVSIQDCSFEREGASTCVGGKVAFCMRDPGCSPDIRSDAVRCTFTWVTQQPPSPYARCVAGGKGPAYYDNSKLQRGESKYRPTMLSAYYRILTPPTRTIPP